MKEIGEYLKNARIQNGVSIDEVSEDLDIDKNAIENIEEGNIRAFKDMFGLKEIVKDYAKYLGADPNYVVEEFNDFLFCHTSKISLEDIRNSQLVNNIQEEKKISSPYTNIPKVKKDYTKIYKGIGIFILLSFILFIVFQILTKDEIKKDELKGSVLYEFTY